MLNYDLLMHGDDALYSYLYRCIKNDIEQGGIPAGTRLPSKRRLAKQLNVSLVTVEGAYAQLIAEGYVRTKPRSGYFACDLTPARPSTARSRAATREVRPTPKAQQTWRFDFTQGALPSDQFPLATWAKCIRQALSYESADSLMHQGDAFGKHELRMQISANLQRTRGLNVDPECIVVGAGAQTLYNLLIQLLHRPSSVGIEDPGYPRLRHIYEANGIEVRPLQMDASGIRPQVLHDAQVSYIHIMPSHQFPTATLTPVNRRYEILAWANEMPGRYILEDDYDCELRLTGKPVPTLAGIDVNERVIYANTFSQTMGGALRVAYLVLPEHLAFRWHDELGFYSCTVPALDQLALARFMENGEYERHVNRTKTRCRAVRDALLDGLSTTLHDSGIAYQTRGLDDGPHFLLSIMPPIDPQLLKDTLNHAGLHVSLLADFAWLTTCASDKTSLVIRYPSIALEHARDAGCELAQAIHAAYKRHETCETPVY